MSTFKGSVIWMCKNSENFPLKLFHGCVICSVHFCEKSQNFWPGQFPLSFLFAMHIEDH